MATGCISCWVKGRLISSVSDARSRWPSASQSMTLEWDRVVLTCSMYKTQYKRQLHYTFHRTRTSSPLLEKKKLNKTLLSKMHHVTHRRPSMRHGHQNAVVEAQRLKFCTYVEIWGIYTLLESFLFFYSTTFQWRFSYFTNEVFLTHNIWTYIFFVIN